MDRTGWIAVSICFVLLLAYPSIIQHFYPAPPKPASVAPSAQTPAAGGQGAGSSTTTAQAAPPAPVASSSQAPVLTPALTQEANLAPESIVKLENDLVSVEFTTHGGGVKQIFLKKHVADETNPVILNRGAKEPIFNLKGWFPEDVVGFKVQSATPNEVVFVRDLKSGAKLTRQYTLGAGYELALKQSVDASKVAEATVLPEYRLYLGLATSVHMHAVDRTYVKVAWYGTNGSYQSNILSTFDGFSLLGIPFSHPKDLISSPANDPLRWAAVKDQFFAVILTSDTQPILRVDAMRTYLPEFKREYEAVPDGISASLVMGGVAVEAGKVADQQFHLYTGPKEDSVLAKLDFQKDKVMEFGWMAWVSKPLLATMNFIHRFVGNYGWSIVILTVLLKALLWYPQTMANISMKRMQVVAPLMKEVQEKYKENPSKMNEETLKIYKEYGVNPLGGCLPLMIQMPLFLGFYYMLQSSIELRHASFLWIHDLSTPDTVFQFPFLGMNIKVNPMPLLMAATMYISMHMTPQPQGVDNPAAKIIKFMPLMFLLFCYNFASALSLYWTVQNLLSILQMYINLKTPMPTLEKMKAQANARKKKK